MPVEHPAAPITPTQVALEAARAVGAGADALHVHPRRSDGRESLAPVDVGAALKAVRAACPSTLVGVSTGAWIVPDVDHRLALIEAWTILPDFAGVNFHEPGALQVASLLREKGIAIEAGIWDVPAAELLRQGGWSDRCLRILLEPAQQAGDPHLRLQGIEATLAGAHAPRLLHGYEGATWTYVELAVRRGYHTRIGLEDTLVLPDGTLARDNAELVAAAQCLIGP